MADAAYVQSSFLGGEQSLAAQGRIDRPDYRTGMNRCLNGLPIEAGAWTRRPGTKFAATTRSGIAGRVIPFFFKDTAPYNMEFTSGHIRMVSGTSLVTTNDAKTVVSISSANPAKVLTAVHGWTSADQVFFTMGTASELPLLHNRQFIATVTSSTEFTLTDAVTGATIDGSTLGTFAGTVTVKRVFDLASPYVADQIPSVRSVQTEKKAVLLNSATIPQVLELTTAPADGVNGVFTITPAAFHDGPYLDPVVGGVLATPTALTGNINITLSFPAYVATKGYSYNDYVTYSSVTYKSLIDNNVNQQPDTHPAAWAVTSPETAVSPNGFVGSDIGRHIRLFSEPPDWTAAGATSGYASNAVVKYNKVYWRQINNSSTSTGAAYLIVPGASTAWWVPAAGTTVALWTWGRITALLSQIPYNLAGAANIGDMTSNGGLAAATDNVTEQAQGAAAVKVTSPGAGDSTQTGYVGRNYSGATDQKILFGTFWPSTTGAFNISAGTGTTVANFQVNMRAKASLPANATDGTLLGSSAVLNNQTLPVTIQSNDAVTAWKYVWFELIVTVTSSPGAFSMPIMCAEAQFFNPTGATSNGISVQIAGDNLLYSAPISVWRLGAYSSSLGWPTCGTYHEGRVWLSGSIDNRVDGSRSNTITEVSHNVLNFSPTEIDGTVSDSCAISYTFNAPDVNAIFWMEPDHQGIICGTKAGEWLIQATTLNAPLTPVSMQAHRVTKVGCANIEPRRGEHTLVIVQKYGRKLIEYFADVFSGKFSAPNLNERSKHITKGGIEEIAYQQELVPVVWARRGDGALIGMTYKRESLMSSQGPTFAGWHRHTLGSGRSVESICVGPSTDGTLDSLCMVTNDSVSNVRHIEVMANLFEEGDGLTSAWFLDNAVTPTFTQNATISGVPSFQMFGLWHLNGKTVSVFAGGLDVGDCVVSSGSASIPYGRNALFTAAFVATFSGAMPVVVGFCNTSQGQIVRPALPQESGARTGPALGKKRRTQTTTMQLFDTQAISFGTTFTKLNAAQFQTDGGTAYVENVLFSGVHRAPITDDYSFDSMICWQSTRMLPANIANIGGMLQTQDS